MADDERDTASEGEEPKGALDEGVQEEGAEEQPQPWAKHSSGEKD